MSAPENLRAGERRNVTVLFADMKDFTSLSERMDPEEMDSLMSQVFGGFESIIRQYDGTVEKYIGDALVAVFGVPTLHEDDPARAVNAALDFLAEIARLNESRWSSSGDRTRGEDAKSRGEDARSRGEDARSRGEDAKSRGEDAKARGGIAFRIGINTGLITTGRRGEHDVVTGHAMAVASRLESNAKLNSVLVSESTRDRCEHDFIFSDKVLVRAKGKDDVLVAYEVQERNARPDGNDSIFVGRKQVLDQMLRAYLRHDPTRTSGFLVTGEPGIGKTRLAQEFIRKLRQLPDFDNGVLFARARRYGTRPFAVIVDLLTNYFNLTGGESIDQVTTVIETELQVERKTAAGFASLVVGSAEEQDNQAFVILYLILKSIVKKNVDAPYGTLLCIDDLYFMDKSSRDFFQFYLKNADARPFFVFLNRDVDSAFREIFKELEVIALPRFDREETMTLIHALASDDLDLDLVHSIVENARGNPLFVREYVRYARENRDAQALPSTIQNIFLTSIESYDQELRDLLKKLSVFAHSFSIADAEHIQRVTDGDTHMVEAALNVFVREGILTQDDELFMFRYDLFKKALYTSLLNFNKKILHRVIADLMISKGKPHPMRLLHHLFRAEEYDRAADALMESPHATSNAEYLRYVDRLLEHVGEQDFDRSMRLMFVKSAILFNNGITEEADSLLKGMIDMAIRKLSPLYAGSAYHLLTAYNMKAYCFGKAAYCGAKSISYYRRAGTGTYNLQNVLEIMASSELLRNNLPEVERILGRIEALEHENDPHFSASRLATTRAEHHLMRSEYRTALDILHGVADEVEPQTETWFLLHQLLALAYSLVCDWQSLKEVDRVIHEAPSRHLSNISQTHARVAIAHHFLGETREAERRLQQAEFNASQIRNDFDRVDALRTLSTCYLVRGDHQKAKELAQSGLAASLRHTATYPVLTLLMTLVEIASAQGEREAMEFYLTEADLLVASDVLLPNRDLMLYHYYSWVVLPDGEDRARHRAAAAEALRHEMDAIGDPAGVDGLFRMRTYDRIRRDIGGDPSAPENGEQ